jgi:hypothetical protein
MSQDQKVTFTFEMSDGTDKPISFIVPGGIDGVDGMLPALPLAPLGDLITAAEFDQKVQDAMYSAVIPVAPTAEHYGMNIDPYGGFEAYLVTIPVPGKGKYVWAYGYIQEDPPTLQTIQAYVGVTDGVAEQPTWIIRDTRDMTSVLSALNIYSSDNTVTVNRDRNEFDLSAVSKSLKRSGGSGNFSFGYGDNPNNSSACGLYGTAIYLKTTTTLSSAPNGDNSPVVIVRANGLPCLEDGTLVPYNIWADYVQVSGQNKPTVAIYMHCPTPPTHLINPATKVITKLQRRSGQGSGLSSIYPEAPSGETANEFHYVIQYAYTA